MPGGRERGWQTLQFDHGLWEDDYLFALVGWTNAPDTTRL